MTIKQQGGIFGRNPTFNNVDVEGNLNVEGSFSINGEVLSGLDFEGAWNASTNSPDLTAITPTTGQFWIVDTAGSTNLDGITNWGVGDWALYDGSAWKRIEGGADGNFVNLTATGTVTVPNDSISGNAIDGGTPTPAALVIQSASSPIQFNNASGVINWLIEKDANNLALYRYNDSGGYAGNPILVSRSGGNVLLEGSLVMRTAGTGIDFSATAGTGTSELFDDYEEGTWTPVVSDGTNDATMGANNGGKYTKVGNLVTISAQVTVGTIDSVGANARITGLPFTNANSTASRAGIAFGFGSSLAITAGRVVTGYVEINQAFIELQYWDAATGTTGLDGSEITNGGSLFLSGHYYVS